jgi:hypothetical protein
MNTNSIIELVHDPDCWEPFGPVDIKKAQKTFASKKGTATSDELGNLVDRIVINLLECWSGDGKYLGSTARTIVGWADEIGAPMEGRIKITMLSSYDNIHKLKEYYSINNLKDIHQYIQNVNFPIEFLIQAANEIRRVFGVETEIALNLIDDPSLIEEKILFAVIYTKLSVEDALHKINLLDEEWFLSHQNECNGRFNFDVDWI